MKNPYNPYNLDKYSQYFKQGAKVSQSANEIVQELGIGESVADLGKSIINKVIAASNGDREAFVKNLAEETFYKFGEKYNVMVFHLAVAHRKNFQKVVFYQKFTYRDKWGIKIPYGVWAFDRGWFNNDGDGGYINWCFMGDWHRKPHGKYVTFK